MYEVIVIIPERQQFKLSSRWGESTPPSHQSIWRAIQHYSASPSVSTVNIFRLAPPSAASRKYKTRHSLLEYSLSSSYWLIQFMPFVSPLCSNRSGNRKLNLPNILHLSLSYSKEDTATILCLRRVITARSSSVWGIKCIVAIQSALNCDTTESYKRIRQKNFIVVFLIIVFLRYNSAR